MPVRTAKIWTRRPPSAGEQVPQQQVPFLAGGVQHGAATLEGSVAVSYRTKPFPTCNPADTPVAFTQRSRRRGLVQKAAHACFLQLYAQLLKTGSDHDVPQWLIGGCRGFGGEMSRRRLLGVVSTPRVMARRQMHVIRRVHTAHGTTSERDVHGGLGGGDGSRGLSSCSKRAMRCRWRCRGGCA